MYFALGPYVLDTTRCDVPCWVPPAGAVGIDLRSIPGHATEGMGLFWSASPFGSDYRTFGRGTIQDLQWGAGERAVFASALGLRTVIGNGLLDGLWDVLTVSADPTGDDRCKPIMPTRRGNLELWLSGRARQKKFDKAMSEAAPVRDLLQRQYRVDRQDALDGKLNGDDRFHRRMLDWQCNKYNCDEDWIIPGDLPRETRLPHSTTIGDTFVDTDDTDLASHTATGPNSGFSWTTIHAANVYEVDTNQCHNDGASFGSARAGTALSGDDHYAKVDIVDASTGFRSLGVMCRKNATDSTLTYYIGLVDIQGTPDNGESWKWVTGSLTSIGSDVGTNWSNGDELMLECDGSNQVRKKNGTGEDTATDTAITGNTYCGIGCVHSATGGRMDDFEAADLSAGGATIPVFYHHYQQMT